MEVIDILRIIATVMLWAVMPFQWWSIILCRRSTKRNEQKYEELNGIIETYERKIAELDGDK